MNTNLKFILTKEQFLLLRDAFRKLAHERKLTAKDMVLYNLIRGKDLKHGFTQVTNKVKLENGNREWGMHKDLVYELEKMLSFDYASSSQSYGIDKKCFITWAYNWLQILADRWQVPELMKPPIRTLLHQAMIKLEHK